MPATIHQLASGATTDVTSVGVGGDHGGGETCFAVSSAACLAAFGLTITKRRNRRDARLGSSRCQRLAQPIPKEADAEAPLQEATMDSQSQTELSLRELNELAKEGGKSLNMMDLGGEGLGNLGETSGLIGDSMENKSNRDAEVLEADEDVILVRSGKALDSGARSGSMVKFSGGARGVLLMWREESIAAICVKDVSSVQIGETAEMVKGGAFTSKVGLGLGGHIVDEEGNVLVGESLSEELEERETFASFKGANERSSNYRPMTTGVLGIDFCIPIGRGQTMLFQGTDKQNDIKHLWPDLMAGVKVQQNPRLERRNEDAALNIMVLPTLEAAALMQLKLEARGCWDRCVIVVPTLNKETGHGNHILAMNTACAIAEKVDEEKGEAMCLFDFTPMSIVFAKLARCAGSEREKLGMLPGSDEWTETDGTIMRESVSDRRQFWFSLISRACNNADEKGSVTILGWMWEQQDSVEKRKLKSYQLKLQKIRDVPRIDDEIKEKMYKKIQAEAAAEGVELLVDGAEAGDIITICGTESGFVPNWEVEEIKSISDGHILLKPVEEGEAHGWKVDPYRSLPRLGMDALHHALISMQAHIIRLKMLQGRDRANDLQDTIGSEKTINDDAPYELCFLELMMEQPAGQNLSVEEEVSFLGVMANSQIKALKESTTQSTLASLAAKLLESEAGKTAVKDIGTLGQCTVETRELLTSTVKTWE